MSVVLCATFSVQFPGKDYPLVVFSDWRLLDQLGYETFRVANEQIVSDNRFQQIAAQ